MKRRQDCGRCGRLWKDDNLLGTPDEESPEDLKRNFEMRDLKIRYERVLKEYLLRIALNPERNEEDFEDAEALLRRLDRRFAA